MEGLWVLFCLIILIAFLMGKGSRSKRIRRNKRDEEKKAAIALYIKEFKSFCTGKTLENIIKDYCLAQNISSGIYTWLYTLEELKSIIIL